MTAYQEKMFALLLAAATVCQVAYGSIFDDTITVSGKSKLYNAFPENDTLAIRLDSSGGASWTAMREYTKGTFSVKIKLPAGFTAGIITAFYLISDGGDRRHEIDFELLGHTEPSKSVIHTNFYSNGNGSHVEQFSLWFNPTEFHTYTIKWSDYHLVWLVDDVPIREHKQETSKPWAFDYVYAPMKLRGSIWDASGWATKDKGTIIPADYSHAPFEATFSSFNFTDACPYWWQAPEGDCNNPSIGQLFGWDSALTFQQNNLMKYTRRRFLHYSYLYKDANLPVGGGGHPPGVGGHRWNRKVT